jgi:hypothetical protein
MPSTFIKCVKMPVMLTTKVFIPSTKNAVTNIFGTLTVVKLVGLGDYFLII